MKIFDLYEEMMNGFHFHEFEDEDRITIIAMVNKNTVGKIIIEHVFDGFREFEDVMDEDDYYDLFGDDDFYKIEHLEVYDEYKGKGYAKQLVGKAIELVKSRDGRTIYLNASPMGFTGLNLGNLVDFYKKFGFQVIPHTEHWDNNKEMILRLKQIG